MTATTVCPHCQGEGYLVTFLAGGTFDARAECWYPQEHYACCPLCHGHKYVDKPSHPNTFNETVTYKQIKHQRLKKRQSTNAVVAQILGISVKELDEAV